MNRIPSIVAATAAVLTMPTMVAGQPTARLSVTAAIEYAHVTEDEGFLGAGPGGGVGVQYHVTRNTSLEAEVGRVRHVRDLGYHAVGYDAQGRIVALPYTERWEGHATYLIGMVSRAFGSYRVRPVVWIGAGRQWHGGTTSGLLVAPRVPAGVTLQPGDATRRMGRTSSATVVDAGLGFDTRVVGRLTARTFGGLRLAGTGNFGPKYILRAGLQFGYGR